MRQRGQQAVRLLVVDIVQKTLHERSEGLRSDAEVDVTALLGHRFRVGAAVFEGTRPRPPCAHLEELAGEEGVARALREERGGICADVIESGPVAVGDEASDLGPLFDGEGLVDAIRERREG